MARGRRRHHRGRRKPGNWFTRLSIGKRIAVCMGGLILALGITGVAYAASKLNKLDTEEIPAEDIVVNKQAEEAGEGYTNVALFGIDSRSGELEIGTRSDCIIVASLNNKTKEIRMISVYRDTILDIKDGQLQKCNAAYSFGGPTQAINMLNKNLDLDIQDYATVDFAAIANAIDLLGGIEIDLKPEEIAPLNKFVKETARVAGKKAHTVSEAGLQQLDGVQATTYARIRSTAGGDYTRTERQRLVIEKAFEKAKSADLMTLESLVAHMVQMCATNIEFGDIFPLAKNMSKYHLGETLGFPSARGDQRIKIGSNRLACIIPQTLVSNVSTLHEFLFGEEDYEPSSAVRSISAHISEVSGMYKEGTEATKAATDQGYIPKATEAAETEAPEELEQSSEGESASEGESGESLGAEDGSESTAEGGTRYPGETLYPGQTLAPGETLYPGQTRPGTRPGESESARYPGDTGQTSGASETTGSRRPGSPADIVPTTEAPYGPGFESQSSPVQEATTAASPGTQPTTGSSSSIIVVDPPAGSSSGPARETTAASPATQPTTAASQGPASAGGAAAGNSPSGNGTSTGNGPSSQPVPVQPGTTGGPGTALQNP